MYVIIRKCAYVYIHIFTRKCTLYTYACMYLFVYSIIALFICVLIFVSISMSVFLCKCVVGFGMKALDFEQSPCQPRADYKKA